MPQVTCTFRARDAALVLAVFCSFACGDGPKPPVAPIVVADAPPPATRPASNALPAPASPAPVTSPSTELSATAGTLSPVHAGDGTVMGGVELRDALGSDAGAAPAPAGPPSGSSRSTALRQGAVTITGRLPAEEIQRVVRPSFGRFRTCYESGLLTNRTLAGTVTVRFTITSAGGVTGAADGGSDLPDKDVVACVVRGFASLSFSKPASGVVVVVYPIIFSPPD